MLRALTSDAIVLADRNGQLTETWIRTQRIAIERIEILDRAFTVGLLTYDQTAAVVLNRSGEDLRSGGAEAIDQHDHRTIPCDRGLRIIQHFDATARLAQLHDRTAGNEQARKRCGF